MFIIAVLDEHGNEIMDQQDDGTMKTRIVNKRFEAGKIEAGGYVCLHPTRVPTTTITPPPPPPHFLQSSVHAYRMAERSKTIFDGAWVVGGRIEAQVWCD